MNLYQDDMQCINHYDYCTFKLTGNFTNHKNADRVFPLSLPSSLFSLSSAKSEYKKAQERDFRQRMRQQQKHKAKREVEIKSKENYMTSIQKKTLTKLYIKCTECPLLLMLFFAVPAAFP